MKNNMMWLCAFVCMSFSTSCGISDQSNLKMQNRLDHKNSNESDSEDNVKNLDLGEAVSPGEIILSLHPLPGMSNTSLATQAFSWWTPKQLWVRFRVSMAPYIRDQASTNSNTYEAYRKRLNSRDTRRNLI
ncbi:MAG: hypothetical protein NT027_10120 [Proteobacteria bacterium]|nr:hypothetical protein [Pseudomonadota bacterium]